MRVASSIEHTRLAADTQPGEIERLCEEAARFGFAGVCVNPVYVELASRHLHESSIHIVTVVGFPLGAGLPSADARVAEECLLAGADEIDMVIPIGLALAGDLWAVERHVAAVRRACHDHPLKVILETGHFASEALTGLGNAAIHAGADYLKTSTGFGPRGASIEDVRALAELAARWSKGPVRVKASGGIRDLAQAEQLLDAGASRLGTSSGVAIAKAERLALGRPVAEPADAATDVP